MSSTVHFPAMSVAEQPAPVHDMAQFSPGLYISIESNYIETVTETEE